MYVCVAVHDAIDNACYSSTYLLGHLVPLQVIVGHVCLQQVALYQLDLLLVVILIAVSHAFE